MFRTSWVTHSVRVIHALLLSTGLEPVRARGRKVPSWNGKPNPEGGSMLEPEKFRRSGGVVRDRIAATDNGGHGRNVCEGTRRGAVKRIDRLQLPVGIGGAPVEADFYRSGILGDGQRRWRTGQTKDFHSVGVTDQVGCSRADRNYEVRASRNAE